MHIDRFFILFCFILFAMLMIIWLPSFSNLGELIVFAREKSFFGISLSSLFVAELSFLLAVWLVLTSYRKPDKEKVSLVCIKRHLILTSWFLGQVVVVFLAAGFLVHQDASWYQMAHGANEIMPAQSAILLICYPGYLLFGGGGYFYARTRLPGFIKEKKTAFLVLTFAPFVYLPYYDTNLSSLGGPVIEGEALYIVTYWLLSISWLVMGVGYLVLMSIKEIILNIRSMESYFVRTQ